ncbi:MAG: hypothetical protein KAJ98_13045, partial [Spirochaetaceae bacterium]|nr:hypothetical protein [Spirochaetaceae bacterium]
AGELTINPPGNTVILAFLGAERGDSRFHPYGSRQLTEQLNQEKNIFAVYLDSDDVPGSWSIKIGGDRKIAPFWLTETLTEALSSEFIPYRLRGTDIQVARLGLQGDIGPLGAWLETDIPAILLKGEGTSRGDERYIQISRLLKALSTIDYMLDDIPENRESTYIFLRPMSGMPPRIISELPYISVLLTVSALLMFVILLQSRNVRLNLRRFARYWWTWPLLLIIVFLFLFLSTLIIEETILLSDFPEIWSQAPGTFIFFKLSLAAALSLNFILITRGLPLPRNPHYYSYAAIMTYGLATLIFMTLNITLAAISLWSVINLMLMTATRKEKRKGFFFTLSLIPYIMGLVVIIREPYTNIISSMLLTRISGNLVLTLLLFPVILSITSLNYWRLHYHRTRHSILTPAATFTLSLSAVITLFWILSLNPFSADNPQPVEIFDHIDLKNGDRRLEIVSPGPIGDAELTLDGNVYPLENLGRRAEVRMPFNRIPLVIKSKARSFLGRRTISGTISGEADPKSLVLRLQSVSPFTLHNSNFPFEMSPSGTSAEIFIGDNPPFPISLSFTVNDDADLTLSVVGIWANPEDPPSIDRSDIDDTATRTARLETNL